MQQFEHHDLITVGEALKILTWVSRSGLYIGSRRTNELTRFPCGNETLFSRQECEALKESIIAQGVVPEKRYVPSPHSRPRPVTELI